MKVTAAVARELGSPLTIEDLELDEMRADEVRVRLVGSGICHTDAIVRDGVYPTPLPAVLGHEGSGVVEAVGTQVHGVAVGDHVILAAAFCGHCDRCIAGEMAYCEDLFAQCFGGSRADGSKALTGSDGQGVSSHFFGQSSFATHTNASANSVVVVDKKYPLDTIGPLGCGLQTGAGAVLHELKPTIGSTVAVLGAGAVGFGALMAAAAVGAAQVIAVDTNDDRLALAVELGATTGINPSGGDLTQQLLQACPGGVNLILDTTANPGVLRAAAQALSIRGVLATVGAAAPGTDVPFEVGASLVKGWTFKTIIQGSSVPRLFIRDLLGLWSRGLFPFDRLLQTYSLNDINKGFEDSKNGTVIKPVLVY